MLKTKEAGDKGEVDEHQTCRQQSKEATTIVEKPPSTTSGLTRKTVNIRHDVNRVYPDALAKHQLVSNVRATAGKDRVNYTIPRDLSISKKSAYKILCS